MSTAGGKSVVKTLFLGCISREKYKKNDKYILFLKQPFFVYETNKQNFLEKKLKMQNSINDANNWYYILNSSTSKRQKNSF